MGNSKIYLDELIILKNILESKKGISSPKLYSKIIPKNKNVLYKKIEKLRNLNLIQSFRTKNMPPISKHKITEKGIKVIEDFTKKYFPKKKEKEKLVETIPPKTIIKYIEIEKKELEPDELATLSESVVDFLLEAMEKQYEEISTKKSLKLQSIAEKIVEEVRNF